jgi:hypothetical protein
VDASKPACLLLRACHLRTELETSRVIGRPLDLLSSEASWSDKPCLNGRQTSPEYSFLARDVEAAAKRTKMTFATALRRLDRAIFGVAFRRYFLALAESPDRKSNKDKMMPNEIGCFGAALVLFCCSPSSSRSLRYGRSGLPRKRCCAILEAERFAARSTVSVNSVPLSATDDLPVLPNEPPRL